jgi:hypothetical protein
VTGVEPGARGARAFAGDYLREGEQVDLPDGTVIIEIFPRGSVKNGYQTADIQRVERGELRTLVEDLDWRSQFLEIADAVNAALSSPTPQSLAEVIAGLSGDDRGVLLDYLAESPVSAIRDWAANEVAK